VAAAHWLKPHRRFATPGKKVYDPFSLGRTLGSSTFGTRDCLGSVCPASCLHERLPGMARTLRSFENSPVFAGESSAVELATSGGAGMTGLLEKPSRSRNLERWFSCRRCLLMCWRNPWEPEVSMSVPTVTGYLKAVWPGFFGVRFEVWPAPEARPQRAPRGHQTAKSGTQS
jgi:hypothetical protein